VDVGHCLTFTLIPACFKRFGEGDGKVDHSRQDGEVMSFELEAVGITGLRQERFCPLDVLRAVAQIGREERVPGATGTSGVVAPKP